MGKQRDTINIEDVRKIDATSGLPMGDRNKLSAQFDPEMVRKIIVGAKERNIDPHTALAIVMQETSGGKDWEDNPFQIDFGQHKSKTPDQDPIEQGLDVLKERLAAGNKRGKTEADIIQAWNGYGKIGQKGESMQDGSYPNPVKSMYGVPVPKEGLDFGKNPLFGTRVIDIRDNLIKTNPDIQGMVKEVYGGDPIHATNEHIKQAMDLTGHANQDDFMKWFNSAKGKTVVPLEYDR